MLGWVLNHKRGFMIAPFLLVCGGCAAWLGFGSFSGVLPTSIQESGVLKSLEKTFPGLGREYMPPFDEGSFLYMPTTMPHASIGEALTMLSEMDAAIAKIPEVNRVIGKIGRVESALDPRLFRWLKRSLPTIQNIKPEPMAGVRLWRSHIRSPEDIWRNS